VSSQNLQSAKNFLAFEWLLALSAFLMLLLLLLLSSFTVTSTKGLTAICATTFVFSQ